MYVHRHGNPTIETHGKNWIGAWEARGCQISVHIREVKDTYHQCNTVVKCAGAAGTSQVEVGLHQGSDLSPFLFAIIMEPPTDIIRTADVRGCGDANISAGDGLERWREALEKIGIRVSRANTENVSKWHNNDNKNWVPDYRATYNYENYCE